MPDHLGTKHGEYTTKSEDGGRTNLSYVRRRDIGRLRAELVAENVALNTAKDAIVTAGNPQSAENLPRLDDRDPTSVLNIIGRKDDVARALVERRREAILFRLAGWDVNPEENNEDEDEE
jgi:hypothetical protein